MSESSPYEYKSGTIVQLEKLKNNSDINGHYGIIKKLHSKNAYRVMLGINTKNDISIKTLNFTRVKQCPN